MNVHDEHYRKIEGRGVEPIEVQETIICNDIPPELHAIVKRNFNLAQANKYMMRCGEKDNAEKELAKAQNYIHRAMHGCWSWQREAENKAQEQIKALLVKPALKAGAWALQTDTVPYPPEG